MTESSDPKRTPKGELTRAEILDSAARRFARRGYHRTTIENILEDLGIRKGAFYHYWDSKEALALELLQTIRNAYDEQLDRSLAGAATAQERIRLFLKFLDAAAAGGEMGNQGSLFLVLAAGLDRDDDPRLYEEIHQSIERFRLFWRESITQAQAEGSVRAAYDAAKLADMFVSAYFGVQTLRGSVEVNETYRNVSEMIRGILFSDPP